MRPISAEEFLKIAAGKTGDGAVVKDQEHGKARQEMASDVGLMGMAKNQTQGNKNLHHHFEPKGSNGESPMGKDGPELPTNRGKDPKPKTEGDSSLKTNEKSASFAYLDGVFDMIKSGVDFGMGGANALAPLNVKQPARLPFPGAQPPTPKN